MPGVPSGKGCNACRKQKKKCDWNGSACSRCRRLQIPCVGGGQQRYKFMPQDRDPAAQASDTGPNVISPNLNDLNISVVSCPIKYVPSNQHTRRISAFLEKLNPQRGVQFNIAWTFGDYLFDVPSRLGANEALDAAADALVAGYSRFSANGCQPTDMILTKYNSALRTLRISLGDPIMAKSAETLCAVMLLLVCQMFLGSPADSAASHAEGAAQILRFRGRPSPDDPFEWKLLQTLRGPLIFEALFSGRIDFTDGEWTDLVTNHLDGSDDVSRVLLAFSATPKLVRRMRAVAGCPWATQEIQSVDFEAACLREQVDGPLKRFEAQLQAKELPTTFFGVPPDIMNGLRYCSLLRIRALAVAIAVTINHIRSLVADDPTAIQLETDSFAAEILTLAYIGREYRPFGSASLALSLVIAWHATQNAATKAGIEALQHEFESDFGGPGTCNYKHRSSLQLLNLRREDFHEVQGVKVDALWGE